MSLKIVGLARDWQEPQKLVDHNFIAQGCPSDWILTACVVQG